ncbi:uncharacterized protein ACRADG_006881 isoform 2-T2 [Cochliomyia hominivorax]
MSGIVIKTEKLEEEEDIKPQINENFLNISEGGCVGGNGMAGGGGDCSGGGLGVMGPKAIVEKTQAARKVANEAKQLNLRLKDQYLLQQPSKNQQASQKPQQQATFNQTIKRTSNVSAEKLQIEDNDQQGLQAYKVGNKRFRVQAPRNIDPLEEDNSKEQTHVTSYKTANKRLRIETAPTYMNQKSNNNAPTTAMQHPRHRVLPPPVNTISPSKCGEIFVTNNARKWTFVCTFCQKTTRDIGEFVLHIKYKHMPEQQYHEDEPDDDDDEDNWHENEENVPDIYANHNADDSYNNHEQDYFDCTSYLDVNVHTESDEMPVANNGLKPKTSLKIQRPSNIAKEAPAAPPPPHSAPPKTSQNASKQMQKNKFVVDLLDDDDEPDNGNKKQNDDRKAELFDYEMDDDEEGVELVEDDNDDMMEGMEDDNLLFLRSSSIDDNLGEGGGGGGGGGGTRSSDSKTGIKKYRSHVRGKAYCNLCDKTFQYYSLYRNHMIKHSNITPYKCQYCSKAFKSKQAIRYHMNTHTKEVQYSCPLCPMVYGTENQFITHVLNHESDTCFPCMVCAKILNSDQEREEHLSTHSEERPYPCSFCNKRFRQKHHLSNHLKLHCQYRCDFCKEEFSSTQTQRRPYACPTCEENPDIRLQVEKQRSKNLNSNEINPLDISYENMPQDGGGGGGEATAECVDLASEDEDDESETSTSLLAGGNNTGSGNGSAGQKRISCQYCPRSYKQNSALNYHMRQKHPQVWAELK